MIIRFTNTLIEILIEYVVCISDPLLAMIHKAERALVDHQVSVYEMKIDCQLELDRLVQVANFMINDDATIPKELMKLLEH